MDTRAALFGSRRQHHFAASLPTDEQDAVSRLNSGSRVDAKSSVKRITVQIRRGTSQLPVIQGTNKPNAFRQDQSGGETSGRDVVGRLAELPLKTIQKLI